MSDARRIVTLERMGIDSQRAIPSASSHEIVPSVANEKPNVVGSRKIDACRMYESVVVDGVRDVHTCFYVVPSLRHDDIAREEADGALGVPVRCWETGVVRPKYPVVGHSAVRSVLRYGSI